jgi:hypothetical protein
VDEGPDPSGRPSRRPRDGAGAMRLFVDRPASSVACPRESSGMMGGGVSGVHQQTRGEWLKQYATCA